MTPLQHFVIILLAWLMCQCLPRRYHPGVLTALGFGAVLAFAPAAALFIALTALEASLMVLWLSGLNRNSGWRKNAPYLLMLNLFFVDLHQLAFDVPLAMLAVSFSVIRIFMTAKQLLSSRKKMPKPDVAWIFVAAFYLPAIVIGPVFSGTDIKKQCAAPDTTDVTIRDYRMVLQGLILAILVSPFFGEFQLLVSRVTAMTMGNLPILPDVILAINSFFFTGWVFLFLQLFAAFWGQSLIAEHTSRFFGIRLPVNFDHPWKAVTIQEFWKRWHRSMAQFVLQYIFLPLNLRGFSPKLATIAAFVFMGLWHNLSIGYFVWGVCHGVLLAYLPEPNNTRTQRAISRIFLCLVVVSLSYFANYGPYS